MLSGLEQSIREISQPPEVFPPLLLRLRRAYRSAAAAAAAAPIINPVGAFISLVGSIVGVAVGGGARGGAVRLDTISGAIPSCRRRSGIASCGDFASLVWLFVGGTTRLLVSVMKNENKKGG